MPENSIRKINFILILPILLCLISVCNALQVKSIDGYVLSQDTKYSWGILVEDGSSAAVCSVDRSGNYMVVKPSTSRTMNVSFCREFYVNQFLEYTCISKSEGLIDFMSLTMNENPAYLCGNNGGIPGLAGSYNIMKGNPDYLRYVSYGCVGSRIKFTSTQFKGMNVYKIIRASDNKELVLKDKRLVFDATGKVNPAYMYIVRGVSSIPCDIVKRNSNGVNIYCDCVYF
jgi:hypothetical protein